MHTIPGLITLPRCNAETLRSTQDPHDTRKSGRSKLASFPYKIIWQQDGAFGGLRNPGLHPILRISCSAASPSPSIPAPILTASHPSIPTTTTRTKQIASSTLASAGTTFPLSASSTTTVPSRPNFTPRMPTASPLNGIQEHSQQTAGASTSSTAETTTAQRNSHLPFSSPTTSYQVISSDFLGPGPLPAGRRVYLIILNYCLPEGLFHVWPQASFRICADGGTNRLHDELVAMMPPPPDDIAATLAAAQAEVIATASSSSTAAGNNGINTACTAGLNAVDSNGNNDSNSNKHSNINTASCASGGLASGLPSAPLRAQDQHQHQHPPKHSQRQQQRSECVSANGIGKVVPIAAAAVGTCATALHHHPTESESNMTEGLVTATMEPHLMAPSGPTPTSPTATITPTTTTSPTPTTPTTTTQVHPYHTTPHPDHPQHHMGHRYQLHVDGTAGTWQQLRKGGGEVDGDEQGPVYGDIGGSSCGGGGGDNGSSSKGDMNMANTHQNLAKVVMATATETTASSRATDDSGASGLNTTIATTTNATATTTTTAAAVGSPPHHHPPVDVDLPTALRLAHLPDVVLGDLDSLRPDVRQFYVRHGVPFMDLSYDQDTNDLAKAVTLIEQRFIRADPDFDPSRHQILVLGALGGRLDHTLANINVLHMFPHLDIALWGDGNLVRLVRPGKAVITPDERFEGPTCGLIPVAGPVTATSSGLRWNVNDTSLRVGGLVSSSNLLTGSPVEVTCDGPLLWTTELRQEPRPQLDELWARTAAAAAAVVEREAEVAELGVGNGK